jgi:RNA polymerase sigma factor (sigma-70 family)
MEFSKDYLDLVRAVVNANFRHTRRIDTRDLFQIGCLGLVQALGDPKFDPKKASFKTFASRCIKNEIMDELRKSMAEKRIQPQKLCRLNDILSDSGKVVNGEVISFDMPEI